jgi:hypothetical protein
LLPPFPLHLFEQQSHLLPHVSPIPAKVHDEVDEVDEGDVGAFERLQVGAGVSLLDALAVCELELEACVGALVRVQVGIIDGVDEGTAVEGKLVRVQVGKSDGTCEGTSVVGTILGALVGSLVGAFVGVHEGASEGALVRVQVGIIDGVDEGTAVEGELERVQVGKSDGTCEGTFVVGTLLGAFVGALVGALVGGAVGSGENCIVTGGFMGIEHSVLSNRWAKQDAMVSLAAHEGDNHGGWERQTKPALTFRSKRLR